MNSEYSHKRVSSRYMLANKEDNFVAFAFLFIFLVSSSFSLSIVNAQEENLNWPFVFIAGQAYEDKNLNQAFDEDETGIPRVFISVVNESGNILDETISLEDGSFWFDDMYIGNGSGLYIVALIPQGYAPTEPVLSSEEKVANPDYSSYYFANAVEQQGNFTSLNFGFARIGGQEAADNLGNDTVSSNITTS